LAECFDRLRIFKQRKIAAEAEKKTDKVLNYSATNSIRETEQEPVCRYRRGRHKKRRRSHLGWTGQTLGCFSTTADAVANKCS
jgi:hypothetical protein